MNRIRTLREERQLSLRDLAHFVDVAHTTVSRLERGQTDVSAEVKARIARTLRVPIADVFPHPEQAP
jgi:DNA-binding XRE family transcriptional regulator